MIRKKWQIPFCFIWNHYYEMLFVYFISLSKYWVWSNLRFVVLFNFFFHLSLSLLKLQNLFLTNGSCLSVISPNCGTDGSLMRKFGRQQVSHFPIIHFAPKRRSLYTIKSEGAKISRQFDMVWQNVAINSGSENLCWYFILIPLLARSDFSQNLFYAKKD